MFLLRDRFVDRIFVGMMRSRLCAIVQCFSCAQLVIVGGALTACSGASDPTRPPETVPPVELQITAQSSTELTGTVGTDISPAPRVQLTNQSGTPMAKVMVTFRASGGGTISNDSALTDTLGFASVTRWTLGAAVGTNTVAAIVGDDIVVFTAHAQAGPATQMRSDDGNLQLARVGAPLSRPLRVRVSDRFGNPVMRQSVTFEVISGTGVVSSRTVESDSDGIATSGTWTLGRTPGAQRVRAQFADVYVDFTAIACPDSCQQQQLSFVSGGSIFVRDLFGDSHRVLVSGDRNSTPTWSPDGRQVAFVRWDANWIANLYVVQADGSNLSLLASGFTAPAWSPDGRHLIASQNSYGGSFCVYECDLSVIAVDGSAKPRVVASMGTGATWSPDGRKIAFVSLSGDDGYHSLKVMNPDGSDVIEVTPRDPGGIDHPTWSPDGRRLAFAKCMDGECNIYVVNTDGTGLTALLTESLWVSEPAWSPDGAWIAFTVRTYSPDLVTSTTHIAMVSADHGGEAIPLNSRGTSAAWRP